MFNDEAWDVEVGGEGGAEGEGEGMVGDMSASEDEDEDVCVGCLEIGQYGYRGPLPLFATEGDLGAVFDLEEAGRSKTFNGNNDGNGDGKRYGNGSGNSNTNTNNGNIDDAKKKKAQKEAAKAAQRVAKWDTRWEDLLGRMLAQGGLNEREWAEKNLLDFVKVVTDYLVATLSLELGFVERERQFREMRRAEGEERVRRRRNSFD